MKRKIIKVWNVVNHKLEAEAFVVSEFSLSYDNRDVLTIQDIIQPENLVRVYYGPDTWKYIECSEEDI